MSGKHVDIESVNVGRVLYDDDVVVRQAAIKVVRAITEKAEQKSRAVYEESTSEDDAVRKLEESLKYALSALRGIETALSIAQGGYVGWDDETSLSFHGYLVGAVIDHGDEMRAHT